MLLCEPAGWAHFFTEFLECACRKNIYVFKNSVWKPFGSQTRSACMENEFETRSLEEVEVEEIR